MQDRQENATVAYAYVVWAYDHLLAQQEKMADRANKLVLVIALVFAALSYGARHLLIIARSTDRSEIVLWLSIVAGLIASVALCVAFVAGMTRSRIKWVSLPATSRLAKRSGDAAFLSSDHPRIVAALTVNIRTSIERNLARQEEQARWTDFPMMWFPQIGFVCTAIFVAITLGFSMGVTPPGKGERTPGTSWRLPIQQEPAMYAGDENNGNDGKDSTDEVVEDIIQPPDEVRGDDPSGKEIKADRTDRQGRRPGGQ